MSSTRGTIEWRGSSARLRVQVNGKTRTKTIRGENGKPPKAGEVKKQLAEFADLANKGQVIHDPARTLTGDYATRWLNQQIDIAPRSREQYESTIKNHIAKEFGSTRLADLDVDSIKDFRAKLAEKGLAPNTRRQISSTLKAILDGAVDAKLIKYNPAAGLREKAKRKSAKRKPTRQTWRPEECAKILELARGTDLHAPVLLAAYAGLRRGEILALRWESIDFEAKEIGVRENIVTVARKQTITTPKNGEERTVSIPSEVAEELRSIKAIQAEELLAVGVRQTLRTSVCDRIEGLMTPTALTLSFRRAIRRSGLPVFRFHDLRHVFATALLRLGVPIPVVAEQLGHLDGGALVLSTYGHVASDMQRDAADRLSGLFPKR